MEVSTFQYCMYCGEQTLEASGNKLTCRKCGRSIYENVSAAVGIILLCDDRIVLAVRGKEPSKGMYDIIGGFVDPGESCEDAIIRETKEETGLLLSRDSLTYLGSFAGPYRYRDVEYQVVDVVFTARISLVQCEQMQAADDVADLFLASPGDVVPDDCGFDRTYTIIQKVKKQL